MQGCEIDFLLLENMQSDARDRQTDHPIATVVRAMKKTSKHL